MELMMSHWKSMRCCMTMYASVLACARVWIFMHTIAQCKHVHCFALMLWHCTFADILSESTGDVFEFHGNVFVSLSWVKCYHCQAVVLVIPKTIPEQWWIANNKYDCSAQFGWSAEHGIQILLSCFCHPCFFHHPLCGNSFVMARVQVKFALLHVNWWQQCLDYNKWLFAVFKQFPMEPTVNVCAMYSLNLIWSWCWFSKH